MTKEKEEQKVRKDEIHLYHQFSLGNVLFKFYEVSVASSNGGFFNQTSSMEYIHLGQTSKFELGTYGSVAGVRFGPVNPAFLENQSRTARFGSCGSAEPEPNLEFRFERFGSGSNQAQVHQAARSVDGLNTHAE